MKSTHTVSGEEVLTALHHAANIFEALSPTTVPSTMILRTLHKMLSDKPSLLEDVTFYASKTMSE